MPCVLMADDPALFRLLETSFLRRTGWEIVRAHRREELLAKAIARTPDLIILDTEVPELDTPACLAALREEAQTRALPVVVIADAERARDCAAAGADATLIRPAELQAFEAALRGIGLLDLRAGGRKIVRRPARVITEDGVVRARVKDISRTGAFLALDKTIPIATVVDVGLTLPAPFDGSGVQARGLVVRQVIAAPHSHLIAGIGVRFTAVDPVSESLIDRFMDRPPEPADGAAGEREPLG